MFFSILFSFEESLRIFLSARNFTEEMFQKNLWDEFFFKKVLRVIDSVNQETLFVIYGSRN